MGEYGREIELYDYIEVLLKYKWLILVASLACGSLAWLLKPTAPPPLYEADIVLMVKELSSQQEGTDQAVAAQSSGFYALVLEVRRRPVARAVPAGPGGGSR